MSGLSRKRDAESGLAMLGSLLLVSMLAVMSTAFMLVMAADVRIAQSHLRTTQAYYNAQTASEIARLALSNDPDLLAAVTDTTDTLLAGTLPTGSFVVFGVPMDADTLECKLKITGYSGKAFHDIYESVLVPHQDPRTYFAITAITALELGGACDVSGGRGVWMMGSNPEISSGFGFDSPAPGEGLLWSSGLADWGPGAVDASLVGALTIRTNAPTATDIVPMVLANESSPWTYYITGDPTAYHGQEIPTRDFSSLPAPAGDNPMRIYVWDHDTDGNLTGGLTLNGTLVCPGTGRLTVWGGNYTFAGRTTGTSPDERYPAIVSRGSFRLRGWGTKTITGLVYVADTFRSDPGFGDPVNIFGAVIAGSVDFDGDTDIFYSADLTTIPAAAFASTASQRFEAVLMRRWQYVDFPAGFHY